MSTGWIVIAVIVVLVIFVFICLSESLNVWQIRRLGLQFDIVFELNAKCGNDLRVSMFLNLSDSKRMNAFLVMQAVQPIEKHPYVFVDYGSCFTVNNNIRIKQDSHK